MKQTNNQYPYTLKMISVPNSNFYKITPRLFPTAPITIKLIRHRTRSSKITSTLIQVMESV
jgi:hypothetical protein